jgi:alpha-D-ribose 1-methylphosphonate 5-triphosphate diphosphatase
MARKLFTNARVVSPDEVFLGTVEWHAGRIVRVEIGATNVPGAEDLAGDYLLPGLVKPTGLRSRPVPRGAEGIEALVATDLAAAANGVTTIFDTFEIPHHADAAAWAALIGCLDWLDEAASRGALRCHHGVCWHIDETGADNVPAAFAMLPNRRNARLLAVSVTGLASIQGIAELAKAHGLTLVVTQVLTPADTTLCLARGANHLRDPAPEATDRKGLAVLRTLPGWPAHALSGPRPIDALGAHDALDANSALDLLCSPFHLRTRDAWPLPLGTAAVSARAARFAGIRDRGAIVVGQRADFVRVREVGGVPVPIATWRGGERIA